MEYLTYNKKKED